MIYQYEESFSTRDNQIPIIMGSGKDDHLAVPGKEQGEDLPENEFDNGKRRCCKI